MGGGNGSVWGLLFVSLAVSAARPVLVAGENPPSEITPIVYSETQGRFVWREPMGAGDGATERADGSPGPPLEGWKGLLFGRKLDLGRATAEDLDSLPGVGPSTARAIMAKRDESGGFASAADLSMVPGLGPKKFEYLESWVRTCSPAGGRAVPR